MRWPFAVTAAMALVVGGWAISAAHPALDHATGAFSQDGGAPHQAQPPADSSAADAAKPAAPRRAPVTDSLGSFSDVNSPAPSEYESNYQIKITYTDIQSKATPSLLLYGPARPPSIADFYPYNTMFPTVHFGNDDIKVIYLPVTGSTLYRFVQALAARPELQVPGSADQPVLSVMIERGYPPGEVVFQHLADSFTADELTVLLRAAANFDSPAVRDLLRRFQNFTTGPQ